MSADGVSATPRIGATTAVVRFGEFELDLSRYELRRAGRVLRLEKIPMDLLILLAESHDRLVTREEIVHRLWGPGVFVDTEQGINTAIRKIRQALRDDPEQPRFVETVVGRGYRFVAPVEPEREAPSAPSLEAGPRSPPRARSSYAWAGALGLAVALAGFLGLRLIRRPGPDVSSPVRIQSLAVLPLDNLSGDPAQDAFSDAMTDELITQLAKIGRLKVIARTSVMPYKGRRVALKDIVRDLRVDAVVEGSVVRAGGRVRITAQLIRAATEEHLWANDYERDLGDILHLQADVARDVARRIDLILTPQEQVRLGPDRRVDQEAYYAYLRGRHHWNRRNAESLRKGIEAFQESIDRDPTYARAYSGLADCYTALGYFSGLAPQEAFPRAKAAAAKAIELDPSLGEAHASLGYSSLYYDWNWQEAEKQFAQATSLDPNYATGHEGRSIYLSAMGRLGEAADELRRAQELDPLSLAISTDIGWQLYLGRHYDDALRQLRKTLDLDDRFALAHLWAGRTYEQKRMYAEAIDEFRKTANALPGSAVALAQLGHAYAVAGRAPEAQKTLDQMKALSRERYVTSYGVALIHVGLGATDETFRWLEGAFQERSHWLVWLKLDPRWDGIRSDPRFARLVGRVGLPP
jgi:TolB-like protein/DNA-binding winged helix-turn-helix (wHTH) protein/Flp pilus assembly protein TadD